MSDLSKPLPIDPTSQSTSEYWQGIYAEKKLFWHQKAANPILVDNLKSLSGNEKKKFFVPLSGKSVDLLYLLDEGHEVFAIEGCKEAIQELNQENQLGLTFDPNKSLFSNESQSLRIYCGNFDECPIENYGPFDCVWDRAAFTALDYDVRPAYVNMLKKGLMVKSGDGDEIKYHPFRYLLEVVDYDQSKIQAYPTSFSEEDMKTHFGDWANFQVVKGTFHPDVEQIIQKMPGVEKDDVVQVIYLLTPK